MQFSISWRRFPFFVFFAFLGLVTVFCIIAGSGERVAAARECNVVLSLDRSASIGSNLVGMQTNIKKLFERLGMDPEYAGMGIRMGFWTFSHDPDPTANYNKYYIDYKPVDGTPIDKTNFEAAVDGIDLDGQTNYQQALSYTNDNNGLPVANPNTTIASLRTNADVVAIISDGIPNFPGDEDPNDASSVPVQSEISAHNAVNKFKADSSDPSNPPIVMGFVLLGVSQSSMNYTINGDKNNNDNVGPFGFSNIESSLVTKISQACAARNPSGYSITPTARLDSSPAVRSGGSVDVHYDATLTDNETGGSLTSSWSTVRVVLKPGVNERKIQFGQTGSSCGSVANPYCDNMSCSQIQSAAYFGSNAESCNVLESCDASTSSCGTYTNVNDQYVKSGSDIVPDGLQLGAKVCYMFVLNSPANGKSNRYSAAVCVMIGKSPTVQVWGGDVRVGRVFGGYDEDQPIAASAGVYTSIFGMSDNKHYGSWVEYGIFAPQDISSIASMSGLVEGIDDGSLHSGDAACQTDLLSRLTFANTITPCGHFAASMGTIPNAAVTYQAQNLVSSLASPINANLAKGRYTTSSSGVVHLSATTISSGNQVVLDLSGHNVTIDGDIKYADLKGPGPTDLYKDLNDVPQLVIIADNITISESARQVDAWLIANGRVHATDGTVKTCEPNGPPTRVTAAMCKDQLRINGPIMARHLELWRTYGACEKDTANPDCPVDGAKEPAEVIDLPGTTLMWSALNSGKKRALTTYSVELPPYF